MDADVLVLLISYISQHEQLINDIDIYAELVNSSNIYNIHGYMDTWMKSEMRDTFTN